MWRTQQTAVTSRCTGHGFMAMQKQDPPLYLPDLCVDVPRLRAQHGLPFPDQLLGIWRLPEKTHERATPLAQHAASARGGWAAVARIGSAVCSRRAHAGSTLAFRSLLLPVHHIVGCLRASLAVCLKVRCSECRGRTPLISLYSDILCLPCL